MLTADRKLRVFLCHASQDKPAVRKLYKRLLAEGWLDPWLDTHSLLPGQDWRMAIEKAVETADNVIICLSDNSVTKEGYIQKEMRYAQEISLEKPEGTVFLIPLKLQECQTPRGLRFFQWVNYFGKQKKASYASLLESLKLRLEQIVLKEAEEQARVRAEVEVQNDEGLTNKKVREVSAGKTDPLRSSPFRALEVSHKTINFDWLRVRGRLDSEGMVNLADRLDAIIKSGRFKIVVDMTDTEYLTSSAMVALLRVKRACRQYNRGDLRLVVRPGKVYEALELAGLLDIFRVKENPLDAF